MHRLIYVSRANTRFPPDLKSILESSSRNNAKFQITGALCFLDGVYCQYLEGDKTSLEGLYQIIMSDPRHRDVKLVELCSITNRLFKDWTMALVTWNKQTRTLFSALNPVSSGGTVDATGTVDLYTITTANAAATFDLLAHSSNWLELTSGTKF